MTTSASMVVFAGAHHSSGSFSNRAGRIPAVDNGNTWNARALTTVAMNMVTVAIRSSMTQSNQAVVTGITVMRTTTQTGMTTIVAVTRNGMTMFVVAVRTGGSQAVAACRSTKQPDGRSFLRTFRKHVQRRIIRDGRTQERYRSRWSCSDRPGEKHSQPGSSNRQQRSEDSLSIKSPGSIRQYAGQGLAGGIQKTGALVQKAANESLAQPVMNAGSKTLEAPQFENRSSVIGDTVSAFTGQKQSGNGGNSNESASQQFVFSPTYRFEGGHTVQGGHGRGEQNEPGRILRK